MYSLAIVSVAAKFSLAFVYLVRKNPVFLQPCELGLLWDDATEKVVFGTFGADPMPGFSGRG
jgi:hypothetical protein